MKIIALEEHYWDQEVASHFKERGPEMRIPALQERLFDLGALALITYVPQISLAGVRWFLL